MRLKTRIILYWVLTVVAWACALSLGEWGAIAAICLLFFAVGTSLWGMRGRYASKFPIKICGYYLVVDPDKLLHGNNFSSSFANRNVAKGTIRIPQGNAALYLELESRRENINIRGVDVRFKGKANAPKIIEFVDTLEPYSNCLEAVAGYGKSIEYVKARSVYKNKKFYYGVRIDAPNIWSGKISFMFSTTDLGRKPARKGVIICEKMAKQLDVKKLETTKQDFEALLKKACEPKPKSAPKSSKT
jgi:hypothetical protein